MKLKKENKNKKQLHILNKNHHTTKITALSILLKLEEKKNDHTYY